MNLSTRNAIIGNAALDYDMEYEDVERIFELHYDNFYEKLEEFIKDRAKVG